LDAYRLAQAGNSVYGRVLQWLTSIGRPRRDEDAPVAGAKVVLRNGSRTRMQRTSAAGEFRFQDVPAGSYSLSAQLDPYVPNPPSLSIEVPSVGCVERFPVLEARASLSGLLIDESGSPAPRKRVELLRRNASGRWYSTYQFWKQTDERGRFAFEGLPDGDYLLGYAIWSDRPSIDSAYPTTYFPGVPDRAAASVLHLVPGTAINDLRIPLGKPHTPRNIHVEVTWPDGRAPAANLLQLLDGDDLIKNVGGSTPDSPPAPHNGIVDFTGYAERYYDLNVTYWIDDLGGPVPYDQRRIARSQVVRLPRAKEPASVNLVLTRTLLAGEER
jgi:hypothetical protein